MSKKKQMTRLGVGPRFTIISVGYVIIIVILNLIWLPNLSIPLPRTFTQILGILLVIMGVPIFFIAGFILHKYFDEGKLITKGVYAYFRHPIYGSWIVFIVPGIILILNSLLGLTIPFVMYAIFKILIAEEEIYLEEKFGDQYFEYKRKVGGIFPKLRTIFRTRDR
jgi:protein-S-isoprenylcysteine O-methyltransferase Ste14